VIGVEALPEDLVASLRHPAALSAALAGGSPPGEADVTLLQTHISHLFLTRDRVFKLRKAVRLPFLSFATREERNLDCLREVELNRRLAPDVYLGVAPVLRRETGGWMLGEPRETLSDERGRPIGPGEPGAEHCVVMRRLPDGRDALSMIESGQLERRHVEALAERLVAFHRATHLGTPAPWSPEDWLDRVARPVAETFELARARGGAVLEASVLDRAENAMRRWLEDHRSAVLARREAGRAVDGHGDLHLDHVWYPEDAGPPVVIDCIEFDADLRRIDVAGELAFFTMDAAYRGREDLGEHLLSSYAALADDYDLYDVVDYHVLHRALVRASVAAVACGEEEIDEAQRGRAAESARRHLEMVDERLDRRSHALIVLTTGLPGTGKSTVAAAAARALGGVVISSDRVRKHLAGLAPTERGDAGPDAGIYTAEQTDAVYAGLLERSRPVLASGRPVVLDATYSQVSRRAAVRAHAEALGVAALLLDVRCAETTTLARIEARLRDPERISDAGVEVYQRRKEAFERPSEWPSATRIPVDTTHDDWPEGLRAALERAAGFLSRAG
jgi:aminoglycoside phosphotransferase family enzyme/predicted kinase